MTPRAKSSPLVAPGIVRLIRGLSHQTQGINNVARCAMRFGVSERTWLRWEVNGVPISRKRDEVMLLQLKRAVSRVSRELDQLAKIAQRDLLTL